ncbi:acyltransferase [Corynebacterium felinum]|uniref:Peptidoglycan/LPS O-acetylase OafA/YrhL n=1 Tax=Corynebacterium felinum TaxID=131318 RepID=A0ABU2B5W9_9CORY|nr:acyltransferase [Corynebacterium felinum]MDF5821485.1 acyltransferase [Corynebacterium felinum]MDR7354003.1 peptidoglycan/LPS O-acetylase OafA/YrhL [Corynebacterium felinum]WJY96177.1 O-acetyltransferase OatA [Corynebacterium felinum]
MSPSYPQPAPAHDRGLNPMPRFKPALEGLRGISALGVLSTHVAFQTGVEPATHVGAILARFDFFVAVFFALSAFLLWRSPRLAGYYRRRFWRIMPAYWVCVLVCFALLPESFHTSVSTSLATLFFGQLFIPHGLVGGLTHLWSLCVEVAFYLVLPVAVLLLRNRSRRTRILILITVGIISLGWAFLPFVQASPTDTLPNRQIYPPAFTLWFILGMLLAELEHRPSAIKLRPLWWISAVGVAWFAGQEFFGPLGLTHPTAWEFALRIIAGTAFAALLLIPTVFCTHAPLLGSTIGTWLGRISYSVFLWHLPVLSIILRVTNTPPFSGHFPSIWILTTCFSILVGWISYELVEKPLRAGRAGISSTSGGV